MNTERGRTGLTFNGLLGEIRDLKAKNQDLINRLAATSNKALTDRIEALEWENRDLKKQLGGWPTEKITIKCLLLGLTYQQAALVAMLYSAGDRPLSRFEIESRLPGRSSLSVDDRGLKLVDVVVCKIRSILGVNVIGTVWSKGYHLTSVGRKLVDAAIIGDLKCSTKRLHPNGRRTKIEFLSSDGGSEKAPPSSGRPWGEPGPRF